MMMPDDVRDARRAMGLTQHDLAVLLRMGGDGKRAVRRWEAGDRHISGPASVAIEAMLTGWRPREIMLYNKGHWPYNRTSTTGHSPTNTGDTR